MTPPYIRDHLTRGEWFSLPSHFRFNFCFGELCESGNARVLSGSIFAETIVVINFAALRKALLSLPQRHPQRQRATFSIAGLPWRRSSFHFQIKTLCTQTHRHTHTHTSPRRPIRSLNCLKRWEEILSFYKETNYFLRRDYYFEPFESRRPSRVLGISPSIKFQFYSFNLLSERFEMKRNSRLINKTYYFFFVFFFFPSTAN